MRSFYVKFFGGISNEKYINRNTQFESYFIRFESGARLELMEMPFVVAKQNNMLHTIGYAHIAFSVGSKEEVDALTAQLQAEGYTIHSLPRQTGDGYYESCVRDPEGNLVEITT